jgi:hypothetical protein
MPGAGLRRILARRLEHVGRIDAVAHRPAGETVAVLGPNLSVSRGRLSRKSLSLQTIGLKSQAERLAWLAEQLARLEGHGIIYTLTVRDVKEITGNNSLSPNPTTMSFTTLVFSPGFAKKEYYQGWSGGAGSVDAFIAAQRAGTTPITRECFINLWEMNTADEYENYGGRIFGFFVPPVSGAYVFYFASDDYGRLFLSTDSSPANLVEIAREPVWSGRRTWVGEAGGSGRLGVPSASGGPNANISGPITLVAGQKYYMESFFTEGGGGDNMGVAVQGPGAPEPLIGDLPVGGSFIGTYASPVGASAAITLQPLDQTRAEGTFATFTAAGTASSTACGATTSSTSC